MFYPDGRVELVPMRAVPAVQDPTDASAPAGVQEEAGSYRVGDGWLTPERLAARKAAQERSPEEIERLAVQWEAENKDTIAAYNRRIEREGSMGWRIYEWRKKQAALRASQGRVNQTVAQIFGGNAGGGVVLAAPGVVCGHLAASGGHAAGSRAQRGPP